MWLVIYNKKIKRYYTKFFESKEDKLKYKRKLYYIDYLILIEDSDDIEYTS